jgi:hypothetical protein
LQHSQWKLCSLLRPVQGGSPEPSIAGNSSGSPKLPTVIHREVNARQQPFDIVDPTVHAIVLSVDEKSQIQALERTPTGLPLKPGRCGTITHDYKRNRTTTLFAGLPAC